jgi:hypothetical protein
MTTAGVPYRLSATVVPKPGPDPIDGVAETVELLAEGVEVRAVLLESFRRGLRGRNDLAISLAPRSRTEDVPDPEDGKTAESHDWIFRRALDTAALAAVTVTRPANAPAPARTAELAANFAADFPTFCHFDGRRRNTFMIIHSSFVDGQVRAFAFDAR